MVQVTAIADSSSVFFYYDDWLDGKTKRARLQGAKEGAGGKHRYVVEVHTSDLKGAGTDANVSLVVFGDKVRRCWLTSG